MKMPCLGFYLSELRRAFCLHFLQENAEKFVVATRSSIVSGVIRRGVLFRRSPYAVHPRALRHLFVKSSLLDTFAAASRRRL